MAPRIPPAGPKRVDCQLGGSTDLACVIPSQQSHRFQVAECGEEFLLIGDALLSQGIHAVQGPLGGLVQGISDLHGRDAIEGVAGQYGVGELLNGQDPGTFQGAVLEE